jgi:5'-nucleotidase/UDP-sugar diphosphatase
MQNLRKFISVLLVIGLLCSFNSSASAANCSLPRIYGGNRYETAVEVSRAGWEQAEVVVLARGDDFADALAGVPLAYANDAPILLTRPNRLVAAAEAEIKRLGASKVFILGGLGAISVEVEEQLVGMGLAVERINGKNRYETESLLGATTAVLAYGKDFPDGLAAASYAARQGYPILLTDINRLPESSRAALEGKDVIVVGGEAVVGQAVIDQLGGEVTRISGPNRAATSVELARFFQPGGSKMYIATGSDFADALTGAVSGSPRRQRFAVGYHLLFWGCI